MFGSLTVTCDGFVTGLCDLPTGSSVTGLSLLWWNTLCVFHPRGSCTLYVSGPVTSVIVKGPYRRTSNLGDGQSIRRSFELIHTHVPTSSGGVLVVLWAYCSVCRFCALSSHILHCVWSLVIRANLRGVSCPRVGLSPVNVMSYPTFALKGDMPILGWWWLL